MAKYQLPQYQSVYRDTGSVQVNQLKRQMFLENMKADDALSTSVMNMDALDQDKEEMNSLAEIYNNNISERAARKDYENLGMTIHTDAMNFIKDYTPIKRSKDNYTAYEKMLSERVAKGDITDSIKQRKLAQSLSNYKGIQKSATGVVDADSYFKGANVSAFVDVNAEIQKAMKDVDTREFEYEGFTLKDGDFNVFLDSRTETQDPNAEGAVWKITQGEKTVKVPDHVVKSVTSDILRRQDVAAFINQEADLNTYMFNNDEAGEQIEESITKIDAMIAKIPTLKELSKKEKEEAIKSQQDLKEDILEKQKTMNNKDLLKAITRNDINNQYMTSANTKYVYTNVYRDDDISLIDKEGVGSTQNIDQIVLAGGVTDSLTAEVLGGKTIESKRKFKIASQGVLDENTQRFGTQFNDDMLNANTETDINNFAQKYGLTPGDILSASKEVKRHQDNVDLMNVQLADAMYESTGMDEETYNKQVSEEFSTTRNNPNSGRDNIFGVKVVNGNKIQTTGIEGQMLLKALQTPIFNMDGGEVGAILGPEASVKDALEWMRDNEAYGEDNNIKKLNAQINANGLTGHVHQEQLINLLREQNDFKTNTEAPAPDARMVHNLNALVNEYIKQQEKTEEDIEEYLNTQQIKFDNQYAASFGDKTKETRKEIRETIAKGIPGNYITYAEGSTEGEPWDDVMEREYEGKEFEIVPEQSGLSNISRMDGSPIMSRAVRSEGKIKIFNIDAGQFKMPKVDEYTSSTGYKVRSVYSRGQWANVSEWNPKLFRYEELIDEEDPSKGTQEVQGVIFKYLTDPKYPIHIRQKDGSYQVMSEKEGLEYIEKFVTDKGVQDYIY